MALEGQYKLIGHNHSTLLDGKQGNLALKISYLVLQLLDFVLTYLAVHLGFFELNPLIKGMLVSPVQLAIVKLIIPLMIVLLIPGKFLIPAIGILSVVVIWNIKEIIFLIL